jgi:hypothetical protein
MSTDRLTGILRAVVQALVPKLAFYVQWEYVVTSAAPNLGTGTVQVSGTASSPDAPIPTLANIDIWPDAGGTVAVPPMHSRMRVGFVDADARKPAIVGLDPLMPPTTVYMASGLQAGTLALSAPTDGDIAAIVSAFNSHTHAGTALVVNIGTGSVTGNTLVPNSTISTQPTTASAKVYSP